MRTFNRFVATCVAALFMSVAAAPALHAQGQPPTRASTQSPTPLPPASLSTGSAETWRTFAGRLAVGTRLVVRVEGQRRFEATLVDARPDVLVLQPRTRVPVAVQEVPYSSVVSLELQHRSNGMHPARAAAIGAATGAGVFFVILGVLLANVD